MSITESPTERSYVDMQSRQNAELIERTNGWGPLMSRVIFLGDCLEDLNNDPENNVLRDRVIEMTVEVNFFQDIFDQGLTSSVA